MKGRTTYIVVIVALVLVIVGLLFFYNRAEAPTTGGTQNPGNGTPLPPPPPSGNGHDAASKADLIVTTAPKAGAKITSPVTITGKARGNWYFEASFPARILDANGNVIAVAPAQAQSDWMTTDFVPFKVTLSFPAQPAGTQGKIILHNDNPSGDPARDDYLEIPVVF